jgi:hypothetical protein
MLRCDLHVHTFYSHDSLLKPEALVRACLAKGIGCVAVTDHNEIDGARLVQRLAPFPVIVGEEIKSSEGEIIGLFLKERIPPNLGPEETIRRIRAQGGLVYIPHPFDPAVPVRLRRAALLRLFSKVDIIEGWNSRTLFRSADRKARDFAAQHGIAVGAGSDAHNRFEIGRGYVEMEPFRSKAQFLRHLALGTLHGRKTALAHAAHSVVVGRAKVMAGHRTEAAREQRKSRAAKATSGKLDLFKWYR